MRQRKRILCAVLALALCVSLLPVSALALEELTAVAEIVAAVNLAAEETTAPTETPAATEVPDTVETIELAGVDVVNPLYDGQVTMPAAQCAPVLLAEAETTEVVCCTTIEEAAAVLRTGMKARQNVINITWQGTTALKSGDLTAMFEAATAHTGVPEEGDYLLWVYHSYSVPGVTGTVVNGVYTYPLVWQITYYTSAAQEAEVADRVAQVIQQLAIPSDADDYEKIQAAYDYVCANVAYDYVNLEDDSYYLKYTAFAALADGTAVCQGYASLIYRLLLELGVDSRLIAGTAGNVPHGWNIAKLDGLYYNLDSTWDAGKTEYDYFLRGSSDFDGHTRYEDYTTAEFAAAYPMADSIYIHVHTWDEGRVAVEPEEREDGQRLYECAGCRRTKTEVIPMLACDVNDDGEMTALDLIVLMKHVVGRADSVLAPEAADINGDGVADILDIIRLVRYLAG